MAQSSLLHRSPLTFIAISLEPTQLQHNERIMSVRNLLLAAVLVILMGAPSWAFSPTARSPAFPLHTLSMKRQNVAAAPVSNEIHGVSKWKRFRQRIVGRFRRPASPPVSVTSSTHYSKRHMLLAGASFLAAILARPVGALAAAGGMGGSIKGPIVPLERYVYPIFSMLYIILPRMAYLSN